MLKVVELVEFIDMDTPSDLLTLGVYKVGLHFIQLLFAFITLCIAASVIAAERYFTVSKHKLNRLSTYINTKFAFIVS